MYLILPFYHTLIPMDTYLEKFNTPNTTHLFLFFFNFTHNNSRSNNKRKVTTIMNDRYTPWLHQQPPAMLIIRRKHTICCEWINRLYKRGRKFHWHLYTSRRQAWHASPAMFARSLPLCFSSSGTYWRKKKRTWSALISFKHSSTTLSGKKKRKSNDVVHQEVIFFF